MITSDNTLKPQKTSLSILPYKVGCFVLLFHVHFHPTSMQTRTFNFSIQTVHVVYTSATAQPNRTYLEGKNPWVNFFCAVPCRTTAQNLNAKGGSLRALQATFEPAKSPDARLLLEIAPRTTYAGQVVLERLTVVCITGLSLHPGQTADRIKQMHEELRIWLIMR